MAYRMTPARRAALRRAQLISAQKRRKYGVGYQAKNAVRQKVDYARTNPRKAVKYAAVGLAGAATIAGGYAAYKSPTGQYNKGMLKSTAKAYRGGKRGQALATHRNRVRPLIKRNTGHTPRFIGRSEPAVPGRTMRPHITNSKAGRTGFATFRNRDYVVFANPNRKRR